MLYTMHCAKKKKKKTLSEALEGFIEMVLVRSSDTQHKPRGILLWIEDAKRE
jgi:hypothetical protein